MDHLAADSPSDNDLLWRFARGERAALGVLAGRYETALLGLASGLLRGDQARAMDVVQDTWVRVIGAARAFRGDSSVKTWLYRIVINRCHDVMRRGGGPTVNGTERAASAAGHEDSLGDLRVAMERLSPQERLTLMLCYHHGLSHSEAADVLAWPLGTFKTRVQGALEALRASMGGTSRATDGRDQP